MSGGEHTLSVDCYAVYVIVMKILVPGFIPTTLKLWYDRGNRHIYMYSVVSFLYILHIYMTKIDRFIS